MGLIGAGSDILSGIFGGAAQDSANETNLQIARETNEQQYKMFQEQLGFNREMWEKSNEYNTPYNQRQRFAEAGLNPYMMLGQTEAGQATMQTAPSAPQMHVPQVQPVNYASGLQAAVGDFMDAQLKKQQIDSIGLDNQSKIIDLRYRATEKRLTLQNQLEDIKSKRVQRESDRQKIRQLEREIKKNDIELKYYDDLLKSNSDEARNRADREREAAREQQYKADYQDLINKAFPALNQATMQEIASRTAANYASAEASRESAGASREQAGLYREEAQTEQRLRPLKAIALN